MYGKRFGSIAGIVCKTLSLNADGATAKCAYLTNMMSATFVESKTIVRLALLTINKKNVQE